MSKDKLEGFLIGLGVGVLVAAFMKSSEAPAAHSGDAIDSRPEPASGTPAEMTVRAAHT